MSLNLIGGNVDNLASFHINKVMMMRNIGVVSDTTRLGQYFFDNTSIFQCIECVVHSRS
jgi:hypothetical protein